ncbi:hypothetical protein HOM50_02935 [bacterium]|jgi:hypothetical protein|nr:hypothetical protein [bacterium]MBT5015332.1 hypothetical protein [bacterium]
MKYSTVIAVVLCSFFMTPTCHSKSSIKVIEKKVNWVEDIVDQPMFARSICDGESY